MCKLQVYNTIIVAQLTYGLKTLQLAPTLLNRLDAFQMRGLRYILGIEHSYYSHVTKQEVFEKANIALNTGTDLSINWEQIIGANKIGQPKYVVKLSDHIMRQQSNALAHMIRADDTDLMKKITLNANNLTQRDSLDTRKSGRPRFKWVDANCEYAYRDLKFGSYEHDNVSHQNN